MSTLTPERLAELEQQIMDIQHELQTVVQPINPDNKRLLNVAQAASVQHLDTSRSWIKVLKGYLMS